MDASDDAPARDPRDAPGARGERAPTDGPDRPLANDAHDGAPRPFRPHDLGAWGEDVAARHLEASGWTVVDRNVRWGRREIDLVARRPGALAFVEVKTRSGGAFGPPQEAVTWKKRREIEAVARYYLTRERTRDVDVRFDVIAILTDRSRRVVDLRHIEDAWRPGW